jgi:hypothetical protein
MKIKTIKSNEIKNHHGLRRFVSAVAQSQEAYPGSAITLKLEANRSSTHQLN